MKHFWSRFVPVLLPACMVDTPIVEGDADRLGVDLGRWCESFCNRVNACENADIPAECPSGCTDYFTETYVGKSDECTQAALRLMDCWEGAACSEILSDEASCGQEQEEALCLASVGLVACSAEGGGSGGTAGVGGSAGSAPMTTSCEIGLGDCTDFRDYMLSCTGIGDMPVCECLIDGYSYGRFALNETETECPESLEATRICGWPIVNREPGAEQPPRVSCLHSGSTGAAGGGAVSECDMSFTRCSDGHDYDVVCTGAAGAVECACLIDGNVKGSSTSGTGICPFVFDGPAAANYACDFGIALPVID